jgi:hypothetical protein
MCVQGRMVVCIFGEATVGYLTLGDLKTDQIDASNIYTFTCMSDILKVVLNYRIVYTKVHTYKIHFLGEDKFFF